MNTKLKEFGGKARDFFKNMSMKVRVILCVLLVAVIAVIAAVYINAKNQPYKTLFSGLSDTEKTSIIAALEENGYTDYRIEGDTIKVRQEQADLALSRMLMLGYPKSGSFYEFYTENVSTLTTNSERSTYERIARAQKMEATIRCFDGVRGATVEIDLGKDQTYVLDDSSRTESTASVTLELADGFVMPSNEAEAIRNVVVGGVAGMKPENVLVQDTIGNIYGTGASSSFADNSQLKLDLQQYYNNMIRTQVMQALSGPYGKENVRVAVMTEVDVNRRVIESKEYTQPDGSYENGGLIGQENVLWVITPDGVNAVGGVPGTTTNADIPLYLEDAIQGAGDNAYAEYWTQRDNKLNENTEQIEVGSFTIVSVNVAVTINENANTVADINEEALRDHVAVAAGLGGDDTTARVSILLAPFPAEDIEVPGSIISADILPFIIIGAAILVVMLILLVTLLRIRGKKKKEQEAEMAELEERFGEMGPIGGPIEASWEQGGRMVGSGTIIGPDGQPVPVAAEGNGANIEDVNTEKSMELRKLVRQFVQSNPEVAAQVIKAWLKGGFDDTNG